LKKYIFLLLIIFLSSCLSENKKRNTQKSEVEPSEYLTLIFAGDVMHHLPQMYAARNSKTNSLNYTPCFQFIKPYIESADFAICNFETILGGKPYSGYPQFSAPDELLFALKDCGFDMLQIANNHILDRGSKGLERTIQLIKEHGLYSIGAYINEDHRNVEYPPIFNLKGIKIALLNYTYGTNGLPTEYPNIVNKIDSIQIIKDIHYSKQQNAEFVIALMHWGWEYQLASDIVQKQWADFLVENGVDMIIGSHPHVVQEFEFKEFDDKSVPVFYSLGNFISNQREKYRNGGILAKVAINLTNKSKSTVSYIPFYVYKGSLNNLYQFYIIPSQNFIENPTDFPIPKKDSLELVEFHDITKKKLRNVEIDK
jgi:poly-gamma-glutamate synthesis protein (capsule biosynthesis protein)